FAQAPRRYSGVARSRRVPSQEIPRSEARERAVDAFGDGGVPAGVVKSHQEFELCFREPTPGAFNSSAKLLPLCQNNKSLAPASTPMRLSLAPVILSRRSPFGQCSQTTSGLARRRRWSRTARWIAASGRCRRRRAPLMAAPEF